MQRFRIFSLDEANRILPMVAEVTEHTRERLQAIKTSAARTEQAARLEQLTREALDAWARIILELGAQPKGVFTVDFRSPDPNVLWCWAPGEHQITHRHFVWESFKDRVAIELVQSIWPSNN